ANGAYHFTGSVTGDLDNNPATPDVTEHFTMTVFANGTYNIDLVEGFESTLTFSSANGQLKAGSPDSVKTLQIPLAPQATIDNVVFFSVVPTASTANVQALIGSDVGGAYDPTEGQLEGTQPLPPGKPPLPSGVIDTRQVVVSTSGIGVDNNV